MLNPWKASCMNILIKWCRTAIFWEQAFEQFVKKWSFPQLFIRRGIVFRHDSICCLISINAIYASFDLVSEIYEHFPDNFELVHWDSLILNFLLWVYGQRSDRKDPSLLSSGVSQMARNIPLFVYSINCIALLYAVYNYTCIVIMITLCFFVWTK